MNIEFILKPLLWYKIYKIKYLLRYKNRQFQYFFGNLENLNNKDFQPFYLFFAAKQLII